MGNKIYISIDTRGRAKEDVEEEMGGYLIAIKAKGWDVVSPPLTRYLLNLDDEDFNREYVGISIAELLGCDAIFFAPPKEVSRRIPREILLEYFATITYGIAQYHHLDQIPIFNGDEER